MIMIIITGHLGTKAHLPRELSLFPFSGMCSQCALLLFALLCACVLHCSCSVPVCSWISDEKRKCWRSCGRPDISDSFSSRNNPRHCLGSSQHKAWNSVSQNDENLKRAFKRKNLVLGIDINKMNGPVQGGTRPSSQCLICRQKRSARRQIVSHYLFSQCLHLHHHHDEHGNVFNVHIDIATFH